MGLLDDVARSWAEGQVRDRAEIHYPGSTATARIRAPRFLGPVLAHGTISDIEVALFDADVDAGGHQIRLRRLTLHLHQVSIQRSAWLRGRMRLRDLGIGRVEVEVDGPSLARAVGLPLVFHRDEVEVRPGVGIFGISARGALSVVNDVLTFRPGRIQGVPLLVSMDFEIAVPTSPLLPRVDEVRSVEGGLVMAGALDAVPPGLVAGGASPA